MNIHIPLDAEISLQIGTGINKEGMYPTSQLQKGLILVCNGQALAEEGVGFGVPVLMMGKKTIFPGEIDLECRAESGCHKITATYAMNLEERLTRESVKHVEGKSLYWIKNQLEDFYRRFPPSRGALMALSNTLRNSLGWQTTYVRAACDVKISVGYTVDPKTGNVRVEVDAGRLEEAGVTEMIVMNEQGAHHFDTYSDSEGNLLKGEKIGGWDEVTAERAAFASSADRLAFSLEQVEGARLFRGRELSDGRLAWSGFGYSLPPTQPRFGYTLRIEQQR